MFKVYIDCTELALSGGNTGIQRVERNILRSTGKVSDKLGISITAVAYLRRHGFITLDTAKANHELVRQLGYFHAISFCASEFNRFRRLALTVFPITWFEKWVNRYWKTGLKWVVFVPLLVSMTPIVICSLLYSKSVSIGNKWLPKKNDIFLIPGSSWWSSLSDNAIRVIKDNGAHLAVLIHDLIPISHSAFCADNFVQSFVDRIPFIYANADLLIANSVVTQRAIESHFGTMDLPYRPTVTHFYLGANLDLIDSREDIRKSLRSCFTEINKPYLCVGTIEPRKNYAFLLDAFEQLWCDGFEVSLCIVGRYGWKVEEVRERIRSHARRGISLFWFEDLTDTELAYCYKNAKALVYPSIIEGFGLPLIEALHYGCPVMASDISVFREIGGARCSYFSLDSPRRLVKLIKSYEKTDILSGSREPGTFNWANWEESTTELMKIIYEHFHGQAVTDACRPPE